jgi:hypothetical protein
MASLPNAHIRVVTDTSIMEEALQLIAHHAEALATDLAALRIATEGEREDGPA